MRMLSEVPLPLLYPGFEAFALKSYAGGAVERTNLLLRLLADTAACLLTAKDGDAIARSVFERIAPVLDLHAYFNFMVNDSGDAMRLASCAGIPDQEARNIERLEFGQAVCGTVALLRRPLVVTDIQQSDDPKVQLVRGYGIRAYACNPLMAGDRLLGTLSFATRSRDRFEEDELEFFRTVSHFVAVTEERTQIERKIRHSQKLESLGVLAGGIAHDFNNLLTGILGNASLLELDVPPVLKPLLDQVIYGAEQASHLTRQLLAYAGKGQPETGDIDVAAMVRNTAALLRVSVPKTIELRLELSPELPPIRVDIGQIQQVIMNLVINASEAIGDRNGGLVVIHTDTETLSGDAALPDGRYVRVLISDNGCGMDRETASRIFDPFFTTKITGRGLGLSAVLGIMQSCGGRITVESRAGQGTTFRLLFPSVQHAPAVAAVPAKTASRVDATVLVVDDEEHVRSFAKTALQRSGYKVLVAGNGEEALRLMESGGGTHVVVLDLVMPVMGGAEALREIRERYPEAKVILTSGYGAEEVERLCSGAPGCAFIQKPFKPQELVLRVSAALNGTAAARATA